MQQPDLTGVKIHGIVQFRLCDLTDLELLKAVSEKMEALYSGDKNAAMQMLSRGVPARPNQDFDLLIGELMFRFAEKITNNQKKHL